MPFIIRKAPNCVYCRKDVIDESYENICLMQIGNMLTLTSRLQNPCTLVYTACHHLCYIMAEHKVF